MGSHALTCFLLMDPIDVGDDEPFVAEPERSNSTYSRFMRGMSSYSTGGPELYADENATAELAYDNNRDLVIDFDRDIVIDPSILASPGKPGYVLPRTYGHPDDEVRDQMIHSKIDKLERKYAKKVDFHKKLESYLPNTVAPDSTSGNVLGAIGAGALAVATTYGAASDVIARMAHAGYDYLGMPYGQFSYSRPRRIRLFFSKTQLRPTFRRRRSTRIGKRRYVKMAMATRNKKLDRKRLKCNCHGHCS